MDKGVGVRTRKVQIANAELRAGDVHRQVDFTASRQVLDIAVSAVFWTARDCASALFANLFFDFTVRTASVYIDGLWCKSDIAVEM